MTKLCRTLAVLAAAAAGCGAPQPPPAAWRPAVPVETPLLLFAVVENADANDIGLLEEELLGEVEPVPDPLHEWNRGVFRFNDALYVWVGRPVLQGYNRVVPEPARIGIRSFFDNLGMPARAVNCLLQGKGKAAETELHRFLINTTVGILGVRDAARENYQIEPPPEEDLGQTLAVWGLGDGCYLVWPIFGPSTLRDSAGSLGDSFLDPVTYVIPCALRAGLSGLRGVNAGSFRVAEYDALRADAVDPYAAMRDAYTQYRARQISE